MLSSPQTVVSGWKQLKKAEIFNNLVKVQIALSALWDHFGKFWYHSILLFLFTNVLWGIKAEKKTKQNWF